MLARTVEGDCGAGTYREYPALSLRREEGLRQPFYRLTGPVSNRIVSLKTSLDGSVTVRHN
ncbi:MAG: hypothetical protein MZV63_70900 [Marinilabiliales bacterium]|nr:hypothetical protein [Marinilabiliales bacterium]